MNGWVEPLLLPFQFPFMQQAFIIAILVVVPASILSCFLVLKGWALMGDAISHAVLPGMALAFLGGIPVAAGAFAAGMACALATGFLADHSRVKQDTVMGIVFSGMFGLGIVLITAIPTGIHLHHVLFGNMLGISWRDIAETGLIAALVIFILLLKWRDFLLHAFDPQHASAIGLPVRWLHYGLLAIIALTIVAGLKAVGVLLVISVLITPGACAYLLTRRFGRMLLLAALIGAVAASGGVYLSFHLDSAPAPTIVLVLTAIFMLALLRGRA
jgi:manganese/iron transport system permease protein